MKRHQSVIFFILGCFHPFLAFAQVNFKTIVPLHPIVPGESFQVQYIVENARDIADFSAPPFPGFRVVSGPNMYSGDKATPYRNLVFTLAAIKEGRFKIYGATCLVNGEMLKSNDVVVRVVGLKESDESCYFLGPGEDPFKKIRDNLFLKLMVDKQTCFIGEPLVATFKLYSRLQSRSDVLKNPGFYGFGVCDMVNINDKVQTEEKLKGHWFDVHTIRKVQLYPLQAGTFTIDPMELVNKIEFSRSIVNKITEQEITENMYNRESTDEHDVNAEVYEINLKTNPVAIKVKPLPGKNAADTFNGVVGNFSIRAFIEKEKILRNEENSLVIDILGSGNFQKISAPVVRWPQRIESFEPLMTDTLNNQRVPLTGVRRFKYIFLTNTPGRYIIPPVSFSFFDLKAKAYKNVSTKSQAVFVSSKSKEKKQSISASNPEVSKSISIAWISGVGLLAVLAGIMIWMIRKRSISKKERRQYENGSDAASRPISIEDLLRPAELALGDSDKNFFYCLNQAIWNYSNSRLLLLGSQMNKPDLAKILTTNGIDSLKAERLIKLIHQCEIGIYTEAKVDANRKELFESTRQILNEIESGLK